MAELLVDESSTVNNSISSEMWNMKKEKCRKYKLDSQLELRDISMEYFFLRL